MKGLAGEERETHLWMHLARECFETQGMTFLTSFETMRIKRTPLDVRQKSRASEHAIRD